MIRPTMPRFLAIVSIVVTGWFSPTNHPVAAHDGQPGHEHSHEATELPPEASFMTTRPEPRVLPLAKSEEMFHFVVYGDRTGGVPAGLKVLEQAVVDTNLLDPDLVMTVGDLIQGYNETPEWMRQMAEYKQIMERLRMRWFPVAGNHDVYWRGRGKAPVGQHDANYEKHFGPLWYSFAHKNAGFIVLYSDEGDPATNMKAFDVPALQMVSDDQLAFLDAALQQHKDADHVFLFLHHPRWIGGRYEGSNWDVVHEKLKAAGNVTAVFAGHIHHMRFDGPRGHTGPQDGIAYYTLATTGGHLEADIPGAGYLHHLNLVTVRPKSISVASLPIGAVMDPKEFTPEFLEEIAKARTIAPTIEAGDAILLHADGSADGEVRIALDNPTPRTIEATISIADVNADWRTTMDHDHFELKPGQRRDWSVRFARAAGETHRLTVPQLAVTLTYVGQSTRVALPVVATPVPVRMASVPADYFADQPNRCLRVDGESAAVRVDSADVALPDGPLTVEAWIKPSQSAGYRGVIAKTQNSEYAIFLDEGVPQFDVHLSGVYVTAKATDVISNDRWTHVAGVYDGQEVRIYVDGKLAGSRRGSGARRTNDLPLYLGADTDAAGQPARAMAGLLDEVRISKAAIYSADFQPEPRLSPRPHSVLMMHFDRRLGPFLLDHSVSAGKGSMGIDSELVDVE